MQNGKIKSYRADKESGFITPAQGGHDVHFYKSVVRQMGHEIKAGASVEFELRPGSPRGQPMAKVVVLKGPATERPKPQPTPQSGEGPDASGSLPPDCVFKSFYGEDGQLNVRLFREAPAEVVKQLDKARPRLGTKQLNRLFNVFNAFATALRMNRLTFEEARAKFGDMYCVLIVRQQKRGVIPLIVKDLFDSHYDLVLREREELLGFHRYLKYILCHFEKSDRPTTGAWKGDF